jgi:exonuclease III
MSIYYQNTRGLKTKTKKFLKNLLNSQFSVICLVETWLQDSVSSCELFDDRYFVFRNDRNLNLTLKSDGGGVLIALHKSMFKSFMAKPCWIVPTVEMVCISATTHENRKLNIVCLYLEPKFSYTKLELLLTNLEKVYQEHSNEEFLILGDWNVPEFNSHNKYSSSANLETLKVNLLFDFFNITNLNQLNSVLNHNGRLLDLHASTE